MRSCFSSPGQPDWKEQLDQGILDRLSALLEDYETCLTRIRAARAEIWQKRRKSDVERILYARGQEELWDTDELYAQLGTLPPEHVEELLEALRQEKWRFWTRRAESGF